MRLLGPRPADVLEVVAEMTGVSVEELRGPRGGRQVQIARKLVYWVAKNCTCASYPEIGRSLNRDHTNVKSGAENVEIHSCYLVLAMEVGEEVRSRFGSPIPRNTPACSPTDQQPEGVTI